MNNFNVIDIPKKPEKKKKKVEIPNPLPKSHTAFIAPTNSGKSVLILNLILRDKYKYNQYFKEIYYISPTIKYDDNFDIFEGYKNQKNRAQIHLISEFDNLNDEIQTIFDYTEEVNDKEPRLIILDDLIHLITNSRTLTRLLTSGRHNKITTWVSSQNFRKLPKTVRINILDFVVFRTTANDLKTVVEDISEDSFEEFFMKYKEATAEPYGFLAIKTRASADKKYTKSFKEYL